MIDGYKHAISARLPYWLLTKCVHYVADAGMNALTTCTTSTHWPATPLVDGNIRGRKGKEVEVKMKSERQTSSTVHTTNEIL